MGNVIDKSAIGRGDSVCWKPRHTGRSWGLAEYTDADSVHVRVHSQGTTLRYRVTWDKVIRISSGRADYDRNVLR